MIPVFKVTVGMLAVIGTIPVSAAAGMVFMHCPMMGGFGC